MAARQTILELSRSIREQALSLGFADCGFSRAQALAEDARRLEAWLQNGRHAGMRYMENHFLKRTDPTLLVDGSVSVISLIYNYRTDQRQENPDAPVLSTYAFGKDYHLVLKEKLFQLFEYIRGLVPEASGRTFVDSAPVLDRAWAREAGLGWIGKNSNLISRRHGSFVFIGEIILNIELDYNEIPENDFCGSCNRCIDACPTGAILGNRTLDAQRCISYQTIENRGTVDPSVREQLENRVFGCDICQEVCPWNRNTLNHDEPEFLPSRQLMEMTLQEWTGMDPDTFGILFENSAVRRAGYEKIRDTMGILQKKEEKQD